MTLDVNRQVVMMDGGRSPAGLGESLHHQDCNAGDDGSGDMTSVQSQ